MSESDNLNFGSHSSEHSDDGARILSDLQPLPLVVDRDELFFQAGIAAVTKHHGTLYFWPSVAAALLLVCAGLGAALISNAVSINRMQQALAATGHGSTPTVVQNESESGQQADGTRVNNGRLFADKQQQAWLRLASAAPLPLGRLTAMGWQELPQELGNGEWGMGNRPQEERSDPSAEPESKPHRPATYLELMRQQREG